VLGPAPARDATRVGGPLLQGKTAEEVCEIAAVTLADNRHDPVLVAVPAGYGGQRAALAGASGLEPGSPARPMGIDFDDHTAPWPLRQVAESGRSVDVQDLTERFGPLPSGLWPKPTARAVVLPVLRPGQSRLAGFVVAVVSPWLPLADSYRGFLDPRFVGPRQYHPPGDVHQDADPVARFDEPGEQGHEAVEVDQIDE
jgi:hypothetical protein